MLGFNQVGSPCRAREGPAEPNLRLVAHNPHVTQTVTRRTARKLNLGFDIGMGEDMIVTCLPAPVAPVLDLTYRLTETSEPSALTGC